MAYLLKFINLFQETLPSGIHYRVVKIIKFSRGLKRDKREQQANGDGMILLGSSGGQCECERGGRCLSICGTGTCLITFLQLLALLANFCNSATVNSKLTSSSDGERGLLQCHDMYRGGFLFSINKMNYNTDISSEKVISSSSSSSPSHVTLPQLFHVLCVIACGVSLMLWAYVLSTESYKGKAKSRMDVVLMVINLAGAPHFDFHSRINHPDISVACAIMTVIGWFYGVTHTIFSLRELPSFLVWSSALHYAIMFGCSVGLVYWNRLNSPDEEVSCETEVMLLNHEQKV